MVQVPALRSTDSAPGGSLRRAEIHNHRQALRIMVPADAGVPALGDAAD